MKIKYLFAIIAFVFATATGSYYAIAAGNVTGWLWGGSENPSDAIINGNETALGWIDLRNGAADGVNIPVGNGNVTGFAWSEHYGWIDFNPIGPYPAAPFQNVQRNGNNLEGWARINSIQADAAAGNSGGWQGWISMNGLTDGGIPYAVDVTLMDGNPATQTFAWSGETDLGGGLKEGIGWIDFGGATAVLPPPAPDFTFSGSPTRITLTPGENLAGLPAADKTVTLTWNITSGTADQCVAGCTMGDCGSWVTSPNKANAGGSEDVEVSSVLTRFTLDCSNISGSTGVKTVEVQVGCNNATCEADDTCNASGFVLTTSYNCSAQCSTDAHCVTPETGTWKEVRP